MTRVIPLSRGQQFALVALRTLIGWHFLYEGYVKLLQPAWGREGHPLAAWSSAGYLKAASGPFADLFHSLGAAGWIEKLDLGIAIVLIAIGFSLMLGLFTQGGCGGAMALLALFYVSAVPVGLPEPHAEGTYLFVNKNLIELAATGLILVFRTGRIAGTRSVARALARVGGGGGGHGMNLTPEQMDQGRRNFLRIAAATPAVAVLGISAALRGPVPGGPVKVGFVGVGSRGRTLLNLVDPAYAQVRAFTDINPSSLQKADEVLKTNGSRRRSTTRS